jgi:hypothetical protein
VRSNSLFEDRELKFEITINQQPATVRPTSKLLFVVRVRTVLVVCVRTMLAARRVGSC